MFVIVKDDFKSASRTAVQFIAGEIRRKPNLVLGSQLEALHLSYIKNSFGCIRRRILIFQM